ncbi:MAG: bifunctional phosphopantothenoylcysteine decarboxylase/phosphopantothenate--cysteine ligase CoaBC [Fretibacterium sp.]|nr:bifunctional phosphopantothenoylcysteine decarboxylase/phosphopantothenate--cysteine ligase CoaBC [Fretibacterium sp.]
MSRSTSAPFKGRRVLLCVTGGIAAYKTPELVRCLVKAGCEVEIILTRAAEKFVTPLTLSTLSGRRAWREEDLLSDERGFGIPHIRLAEWAEAVVVAPCTANTAAVLAQGLAQGLIGAALLAARAPVMVFPAMNVHMLEHPATQENLRVLAGRGVRVVEPAVGALACGEEGRGRMPEPEEIAEEVFRALTPKDMEGLHVLVTAGPTREYLDPVRFISNPSTGRMGLAMAREAWRRGAEVRVVLGPIEAPCPLHGFEVLPVVSALEMRDAVTASLPWAHVIVKAAAVGDYRAKQRAERKVKREGREELSIELTQNPDIAAEVGSSKRPDQILIGFAAETDDLLRNARAKLESKGLDAILVNDVLAPGCGFASETNTLRLICRNGEDKSFSGLKEDVARAAWGALAGQGLFPPMH